ncbi:MAG TPA: hypothetical protein VI585_05015 [Candidatus Binatia bacterium]
MNKHLLQGVVCGGIFAAAITWIAASDAMTEGGLALLASVVFGLAAGLCIGGQFCDACGRGKGSQRSHRASSRRDPCRGLSSVFAGNTKVESHGWRL